MSLTLKKADAFQIDLWIGGLTCDEAQKIMQLAMDAAIGYGGSCVGSIGVAHDAKKSDPL